MKILYNFVLIVLFAANSFGSEQPTKRVTSPAESSRGIHLTDSERSTYEAITFSNKIEPFSEEFCEHVLKCVPAEVKQRIDILTDPEISSKVPLLKKVIFYGPPGTGKTTLGKIIAQKIFLQLKEKYKIDKPYMLVSTSMLANEYSNSGASGIRKIMNIALANCSSVVVDEIDAIAKKKSKSKKQNDDDQTAKALWQVLDRVQELGLTFIGTTNDLSYYPEPLQERFCLNLYQLPIINNLNIRKSIIVNLLGTNLIVDKERTIDSLNKKTDKYSVRIIESIVQFAIGEALRRNKTTPVITKEDIEIAIQKHLNNKKQMQATKWDKKEVFNYTIQTIGAIANIVSIINIFYAMRHNQQMYDLSAASFVANQLNAIENRELTIQSNKQSKTIADRADARTTESLSQAKDIAKKADERAETAAKLQKDSLEMQGFGLFLGGLGLVGAAASGACTIS